MLLINEDERDIENDGQVLKLISSHHVYCCNNTNDSSMYTLDYST